MTVAGPATRPSGGGAIVLPPVVAGAYLPRLRQQLAGALRTSGDGTDLVLDCRQVQELSPAAQALLVGRSRVARLRGRRLRLVDPSPATVQALRSTGLDHLLAARP